LAKKPIKPNVWDENERRFFEPFVAWTGPKAEPSTSF
jgi:hypothetical protein